MRLGATSTTRIDLINPISSVSGTVPEMREVRNWYFDLPGLSNVVRDYVDALEGDPCIRPVVTKTIKGISGSAHHLHQGGTA